MKYSYYRSRMSWAFFMAIATVGHVGAASLQPLTGAATGLKSRILNENTLVGNVKEIYIIPMPEVTVSEHEALERARKAQEEARKAREKLEKERLKLKAQGLPAPIAFPAATPLGALDEPTYLWQTILAQPKASSWSWRTKKPDWQILHQSLGRKVARTAKELEGYAYKALSQLTYRELRTSSTKYQQYAIKFLPEGKKVELPPLPRIIEQDKAYFFIPVEGTNPQKIDSSAKHAWLAGWSKYGIGSLGTEDGALNMVSPMGGKINEDNQLFIQQHWKEVVKYVNEKVGELYEQAKTRGMLLPPDPEEYRWNEFTGVVTISSDASTVNSILDPVNVSPLTIDGKYYRTAQAYCDVEAQKCNDKKDQFALRGCVIKAMFQALYYKLTNDLTAKTTLQNTGNDTVLLYVTQDPLFGIGVDERGQNHVGRILMFFRDRIKDNLFDAQTIDTLWSDATIGYMPSPQAWGKNYSQEALIKKGQLRSWFNPWRWAIYKFVARKFGWRR